MKWYFASRTRHRELIDSVSKALEGKGHEVTFKWPSIGSLAPYDKNAKKCSEVAKNISSAIPNADVFVLISDQEGTDMFVELGIALACWEKNKKYKIYVVGEHNKRSLMHLHPGIIHTNSLNEVFSKECPEISELF